jgi:hypothetical protein
VTHARARRTWGWAEVALVAAVGLALRLHDVGGGQFRGDEALHLARAAAIARGETFPATGMRTTDGLPTPPVFHWLLAGAVLVVGAEPARVMALVAVASGLACGGLVLAGRRLVGRRAALVAGLLVAVSPGLLFFGRKVWNPDLLLPLSVLTLGLVGRAARSRGRDGARGAALAVAVGAAAIHYSAVAAVAAVAATWRPGLRVRAPWLALGLWAVLLAPFAAAAARELSRDGPLPPPTPTAGAPGIDPVAGRGPIAAARVVAGALGAGAGLVVAGPTAVAAATGPLGGLVALDGVLLAVAGVGAVLLARRARRPGPARPLLVWVLVGGLPLGVGLVAARDHYALVLAPPLALCAGLACARAERALRRRGLAALALVGVAALGLEAVVGWRLVAELGARGGALDGPHDVGLRWKEAAVSRCLDQGLAVADYPTLEFLILADLEGRRRRIQETQLHHVPWWDVDLALPKPQPLNGLARIGLGPAPPGAWSDGPVWVERLPVR